MARATRSSKAVNGKAQPQKGAGKPSSVLKKGKGVGKTTARNKVTSKGKATAKVWGSQYGAKLICFKARFLCCLPHSKQGKPAHERHKLCSGNLAGGESVVTLAAVYILQWGFLMNVVSYCVIALA